MRPSRRAVGGGLLAGAALVSGASLPREPRPVVIAHRGASGERPEHTAAAYRLAIAQGADFIEPDLVVSRDGVLICRHETEIGETTDIGSRPEFASRRTVKRVDGRDVQGWFAEDFTLAELKTLRCRERIPRLRPANTALDGQEPIVTLAELIALAQASERSVGLVVELKHVAHLAEAGHDLVALTLAELKRTRWVGREAPVIIECFEAPPLRRLRGLTDTRLVQLVAAEAYPDGPGWVSPEAMTPDGLREIARYADGIGPEKTLILPRDAEKRSRPATSLARDARAAGLDSYAWTCRAENYFLPAELRSAGGPADHGDLIAECQTLYAAGVTGVFCDHPAVAVAARNRLVA